MHALANAYVPADPAWKRYAWDDAENNTAERQMPAPEMLAMEKHRLVLGPRTVGAASDPGNLKEGVVAGEMTEPVVLERLVEVARGPGRRAPADRGNVPEFLAPRPVGLRVGALVGQVGMPLSEEDRRIAGDAHRLQRLVPIVGLGVREPVLARVPALAPHGSRPDLGGTACSLRQPRSNLALPGGAKMLWTSGTGESILVVALNGDRMSRSSGGSVDSLSSGRRRTTPTSPIPFALCALLDEAPLT
jgi:hypothetical protein